MNDQNYNITTQDDTITLTFEEEVFFRNFYFSSDSIKNRIAEHKKCVIDAGKMIYCNSSCIAFLFSAISFMNKNNIHYEIIASEYLNQIFTDLNMRKIIKL